MAALACLAALGSLSTQATAQEDTPPQTDSIGPVHRSTPPWQHMVGAFAGATRTDLNDGPTQFTLRAHYERRFHEWYGVGGLLEVSFGEPREAVIAAALTLHPTGGLRVAMAMGGDRESGEWAYVYRIALEYDFALRPGIAVGPAAALDFTRGRRIVVLGATVGRMF